jgi:hypothetical protein
MKPTYIKYNDRFGSDYYLNLSKCESLVLSKPHNNGCFIMGSTRNNKYHSREICNVDYYHFKELIEKNILITPK